MYERSLMRKAGKSIAMHAIAARMPMANCMPLAWLPVMPPSGPATVGTSVASEKPAIYVKEM